MEPEFWILNKRYSQTNEKSQLNLLTSQPCNNPKLENSFQLRVYTFLEPTDKLSQAKDCTKGFERTLNSSKVTDSPTTPKGPVLVKGGSCRDPEVNTESLAETETGADREAVTLNCSASAADGVVGVVHDQVEGVADTDHKELDTTGVD